MTITDNSDSGYHLLNKLLCTKHWDAHSTHGLYLVLLKTLPGRCQHRSPFTDEETEAQRARIT